MHQPAPHQDLYSGVKAVTARLSFDVDRLAAYLDAQLDGFGALTSVRQFRGGQSNPTYLLETPEAKYVLRRRPPGPLLPSAHAVDREFRAIQALGRTTMPVPRAWHLCLDDSIIGTAFYVMSFVEGRVFWEPLTPGLTPAQRSAVYDSMNATLASLHGVDPQEVGLADFGRPGNYFARQIGRWSRQYENSRTVEIPEMDRLATWLPAHIPVDDEISVVHGDYRLDNIIFHSTEPKVVAVLDWELCTLGHPLADITYNLLSWRMPGAGLNTLPAADLAALGVPSETQYLAAYCARTGRAGIGDLDFYLAYNFFRLAAIRQGIIGRMRDGTATSDDISATTDSVRQLAGQGWSHAQSAS